MIKIIIENDWKSKRITKTRSGLAKMDSVLWGRGPPGEWGLHLPPIFIMFFLC